MRRKIVTAIFQQHKAFYCYLLLSFWIFVTIVGLYRYVGINDYKVTHKPNVPSEKPYTSDDDASPSKIWLPQKRFKKVYKSCNPAGSIATGSENADFDNFTLEGVVVIFRHGDRGPMNHVRNLDTISCDYQADENDTTIYNDYTSFVSPVWPNAAVNTLYQFYGQPNAHPPVPDTKLCEIGQLTLTGVVQHLKLGSVLRATYFEKLFANSSQIHGDVFAYTTKYRRTFQSLSAFLYGFLRENFHKIPLYTASSMYYCFEDCACPATDGHNRVVLAENSRRLRSHPAILNLMEEIASTVYTMSDGSFARNPHYMKDALLTYICHNSQLPRSASKCLRSEHVTRVFSYIDWDIRQYAKSIHRYKFSLLTAYGFLKNIVSHLLKIVSNESPKMVLYSAHDKTVQYLLTALGITTSEAVSPPYASRAIFEIYGSKQYDNSSLKKFYFRIILNRKNLTNRVKFCAEKNSVHTPKNSKLCSFESLLRFLHDDYFSIFNAANFKEACVPIKF